MASRVVGVCFVVVLVVSLFAAGSAPVGADDGDGNDWSVFLFHDHDEDDEDEDSDDEDVDSEDADEDLDEDDDRDDGEAEEDGDDRARDSDCNELDHDRGHGNDCDGHDGDNSGLGSAGLDDDDDDGVGLPLVQPTATPTPTPTTSPTPTPNPTATPAPTPSDSDEPSSGSGGTGGSDEVGSSSDDDPVVRNSSHEIGGFQAVRSVSVNRTTITPGDRVEIVVAVENVNDEPTTVPVELAIFGEVVAVERVTIPGGSTERVRFVQQFDAPGTYHPSVGDVGATVRVEPRSTTPTAETVVPTGQVGFGPLVALLALVLGMLAARRR
jgi:hypothetical protein